MASETSHTVRAFNGYNNKRQILTSRLLLVFLIKKKSRLYLRMPAIEYGQLLSEGEILQSQITISCESGKDSGYFAAGRLNRSSSNATFSLISLNRCVTPKFGNS